MGLVRSIEKFRPEKGNKLSSYAVGWIRQHVGRYIDENSNMIRVPRAARDKGAEQARFVSDYEKVAPMIKDEDKYHV